MGKWQRYQTEQSTKFLRLKPTIGGSPFLLEVGVIIIQLNEPKLMTNTQFMVHCVFAGKWFALG